ncbi:MAG: PadR family transcriptional regulator [Candidatus Micrarchaeota archaeon]|nr:PadR family transcriptional regulator [Candidatus Micrarchaeota archaeon]
MAGKTEKSRALERLERTLTSGNMWLYILSTLKRKKAYAYTLGAGIREAFGWEPGMIMGYVILYKMEAEGLIRSKFEGRRKYYEITQKGRGQLALAKKKLAQLSKKL